MTTRVTNEELKKLLASANEVERKLIADMFLDPSVQTAEDVASKLATMVRQQSAEIDRLTNRVAELEALYAPFKPMTIEEADAEIAAVEAEMSENPQEPISEEQVEHAVRYATEPGYRAEYLDGQLKRMCHANRGLRSEIDRLTKELEAVKKGYESLDKNWQAVHESAMESICTAIGLPKEYEGGRIFAIAVLVETIRSERDAALARAEQAEQESGDWKDKFETAHDPKSVGTIGWLANQYLTRAEQAEQERDRLTKELEAVKKDFEKRVRAACEAVKRSLEPTPIDQKK